MFVWVSWHINLCRLFNAKSIFIQINSSISNAVSSRQRLYRYMTIFNSKQQERPANMREHIHSSSLTLPLTYFEQSAKHHEESTPNLWTIGVWEIILSSFIFPSKPTDPQLNKLDIFNSRFDFSILIPVLMTAFQLLLWLWRLHSFSSLQPSLLPATYSTRIPFVSSC